MMLGWPDTRQDASGRGGFVAAGGKQAVSGPGTLRLGLGHELLVGFDDLGSGLLFGKAEIYLLLRILVLQLLLFLAHLIQAWDALVRDVHAVINTSPERILLAALFGEVGLEIEPHEPEEGTGTAPA